MNAVPTHNDLGDPLSAGHREFLRRHQELQASAAAGEAAARRCYAAHLAAGGHRIFRRDGRELFSAES